MRAIRESDWKILRQLKSQALERICKQILLELEQTNADNSKSFYQRYLSIYEVVQKRDKEIARIFDNLSRSTALMKLVAMKSHGLLTEEEFSRFSEETRQAVDLFLGN